MESWKLHQDFAVFVADIALHAMQVGDCENNNFYRHQESMFATLSSLLRKPLQECGECELFSDCEDKVSTDETADWYIKDSTNVITPTRLACYNWRVVVLL